MKRVRAAAIILTAAIPSGACGSRGDAPPFIAPLASSGPLPDGIVARVGSSTIQSESVGRIAGLQRIDIHTARDRAVRDALFAHGAEARGLEVTAEVRSVLARRLLRSIRTEAEKAPIAAAELTAAAERREQHNQLPATIVAPELLEADILDARAHAAVAALLTAGQAQAERAKDADALLALVSVER